MASFRGVKRRFELVWSGNGKVFIDDYAHHPTEINALLNSVRVLYPGKRVLGIFQPHLFSRTRDFMDGFAESLSALDTCWLLDIYPARELPLAGINAQTLLTKMSCEKALVEAAALPEKVLAASWDVLLSIGAGDIDRWVQPIVERLQSREAVV
jgi:UDP-N-acetylmuramate--alanine ligase